MKIKVAACLFALVVVSAFPQAPAPAAPMPAINLAIVGTAEEFIALEHIKVDYVFGTPEQKLAVLAMYASDFHGIGYGRKGPARSDYSIIAGALKSTDFPVMPPGTFKMSDPQVLPLQPGCTVVTYTVSGPGPDGKPWSAFLSSTWVKQGTEWKTTYYQATAIPQP